VIELRTDAVSVRHTLGVAVLFEDIFSDGPVRAPTVLFQRFEIS